MVIKSGNINIIMKLGYISMICYSIVFTSCSKSDISNKMDEDEEKKSSFEVMSYNVTQTTDASGNPVKQVTFNFLGDASKISFYSGIEGNDYTYKDDHIIRLKGLLSSFNNTLASTGAQENQLSVLVSTDFSGTYNIANIKTATWTDITSRYAITPVRNTTLASGIVDLKDLLVSGKPLYFAFRYICLPQAANGANSTWRIRDFSLQSKTDLDSTTLATHTNAGWQMINDGAVIDAGRGAVIETNGAVRFNGNHMNKEIRTESWAITKGFTVEEVNLGPDLPIVIKNVNNPWQSSFSFNYTTSGTYKVAFVVQYEDQSTDVRELEVVVH